MIKSLFLLLAILSLSLSVNAAEGDHWIMISSKVDIPDSILKVGDLLLNVNGTCVTGYKDPQELNTVMNSAFKPQGQTETYNVLSYGETREVNLTFTGKMNFNCSFIRESNSVLTEKARQDFSALLEVMDRAYVKSDRQDYAAARDYLKTIAQGDLSRSETMDIGLFLKHFSRFLSLLNDGHAGFLPSDVADAMAARFLLQNNDFRFLPLHVEITETGVYTKKTDLFDRKVRIIGINGEKIEDLIEEMLQFANGDTNQNKLDDVSENFFLFYYLVKGSVNSFQLTVRDLSRENELTLTGVPYQDLLRFSPAPWYYGDPFGFSIKNDVAVMTLKSFGGKKYFYEFVDKCFQEIKDKNLNRLIIDLRQNGGGGTGYLKHLLSRLTDRKMQFWDGVLVKCSQEAKDYGYEFDADLALGESRQYTYEAFSPTAERMFSGEVELLVGRKTFSTAFDCAVCFSAMKLGTLIGSNTGGNNYSTEQGFRVSIPSAGVEFSVPFKIWINVNTPAYDSDLSLKPVTCIYQSESDYFNDIDTVLEYAVKSLGNAGS
ncbi:MAG: S41 family peptidase [Candidatus Wallbacteria bacterium]|nr:S41 family peptidase [Candidatus Wallbacteria bacterium]